MVAVGSARVRAAWAGRCARRHPRSRCRRSRWQWSIWRCRHWCCGCCCRPIAAIGLLAFAGAYATAIVAGVISHVPGGLGVFESLIVLALPGVPATSCSDRCSRGARSTTCCRCWWPRCCSAARNCAPSARRWRASSSWRRPTSRRSCRRSAARWCSSPASCCWSRARHADDRSAPVAAARHVLPLTVLELSHLAGSVIGLALLILARALFRRVARGLPAHRVAARGRHARLAAAGPGDRAGADPGDSCCWCCGSAGARSTGRRAIMAQRFTPAWIASLAIVISTAVWIGFFANRHVDTRTALWWTFALRRRCAAHAARLAGGGAAGGGLSGDESAAAGAARAGRRLGADLQRARAPIAGARRRWPMRC